MLARNGTTVDIDFQPLFTTLSKISGNRVVPDCFISVEGDITKIQIPVREINPGDKTDSVLRRFAKDWIRRQIEDHIGIDARFERLPANTAFFHEDEEVRVVAALTITWWPRKEVPELEQLKRQQKNWKGTRPEAE